MAKTLKVSRKWWNSLTEAQQAYVQQYGVTYGIIQLKAIIADIKKQFGWESFDRFHPSNPIVIQLRDGTWWKWSGEYSRKFNQCD